MISLSSAGFNKPKLVLTAFCSAFLLLFFAPIDPVSLLFDTDSSLVSVACADNAPSCEDPSDDGGDPSDDGSDCGEPTPADPICPEGQVECGDGCIDEGADCCDDETGEYCAAGSTCCNSDAGGCIPEGDVCCGFSALGKNLPGSCPAGYDCVSEWPPNAGYCEWVPGPLA